MSVEAPGGARAGGRGDCGMTETRDQGPSQDCSGKSYFSSPLRRERTPQLPSVSAPHQGRKRPFGHYVLTLRDTQGSVPQRRWGVVKPGRGWTPASTHDVPGTSSPTHYTCQAEYISPFYTSTPGRRALISSRLRRGHPEYQHRLPLPLGALKGILLGRRPASSTMGGVRFVPALEQH